MLLYIERNSNYNAWIVDVKTRVAYNVCGRNIFLPEMSWVLSLRDCELGHFDVDADHKRDYVSVLMPERQMIVLDTHVGFRPVDETLYKKLIELIDYLSER